MTIAFIAGTSRSCSDGGNNVTTVTVDTTAANLIVIHAVAQFTASITVSDNQGNTWTGLTAQTGQVPNCRMYYCQAPTTNASHTFTISTSGQVPSIHVSWYSGVATTPFDVQNGASGVSNTLQPGATGTPSENDELVVAGMGYQDNTTISINSSFTMTGQTPLVGFNSFGGGAAYLIQTTAADVNPTFSWTNSTSSTAVIATFKAAAAAGIAFDAAANSGDQAAASSYSGSASWAGANRMLAIDVSCLGAGVTVTAMTYGGANCTFVGSRSTVTSFGSVESWRICSSDSGAPAAGANTLAITLSGSLEFAAEWVSYTGVNQSLPTEAFNSAQATNVGAADATVTITSIADNCWIHGAVVASDTTITANQTTRNNISGTLGSGANEDNNTALTPAGAQVISYTNVGAAVTWAIGGYAIRPVAASDGGHPTVKRFGGVGFAHRMGGAQGNPSIKAW